MNDVKRNTALPGASANLPHWAGLFDIWPFHHMVMAVAGNGP
jgi:hypothetical protein